MLSLQGAGICEGRFGRQIVVFFQIVLLRKTGCLRIKVLTVKSWSLVGTMCNVYFGGNLPLTRLMTFLRVQVKLTCFSKWTVADSSWSSSLKYIFFRISVIYVEAV